MLGKNKQFGALTGTEQPVSMVGVVFVEITSHACFIMQQQTSVLMSLLTDDVCRPVGTVSFWEKTEINTSTITQITYMPTTTTDPKNKVAITLFGRFSR